MQNRMTIIKLIELVTKNSSSFECETYSHITAINGDNKIEFITTITGMFDIKLTILVNGKKWHRATLKESERIALLGLKEVLCSWQYERDQQEREDIDDLVQSFMKLV